MSTAAPPPPVKPASTAPTAAKGTKSDRVIEDRITEACRALWWAELTRACLRVVLVAMSGLLVWLVMDQWFYSPGTWVRSLVWLGAILSGAAYLWTHVLPLLRSQIRPEYAARSLERDMPDLRQSLTSYVTLREQPGGAGLRGRVVRSMGAATAGRLRTFDELPTEATGTLRWWVATAAALAVLVAYAVLSPKNSFQSAARLAAPLAEIDPPRRVSISEVLPGDSEAIAGRKVAVSAEIDGMQPSETALCKYSLPAEEREVPMVWDEADRRYHAEIDLPYSVSGRVPYTIEAGDAQAGPFHLSVQDLPVVALQSVHYAPPAYTGQQPHTTSSGAITALDGTFVTITATTNRAVEKAKIEFNPRPLGERMQATAGATAMDLDASGTQLTVTFPLKSARGRSAAVEPDSYRIQVTDSTGQTNPEPIVYPIRVIADLPPEVSITLPFESPTEVEINAQQIIEVHGSDPDFGLKTIELELRSGIDTIAQPILWEHETGGKGNQVVEFAFRPTFYDLRIGDEVQVVAVATDNRVLENDPSVEPNITRTDPIVLKIVAGDPNQPNDPNDDPPPQRNDGSQKQSDSNQSSESGQGEEQSGQGGGGGSGDSSGQAQSEQNQGEGGSGQGTSDQSNPSESQDGSGGTGENQQNASENQDPSGSGSEGGESGAEGTPSGQPQSGEPGDGSMDPSQQNDPQNSPPNGEGNAGETASEQNASGDPAEGSGTGDNANGSQESGTGSQNASSGQPNSSERQGDGQGGGDSSQEAPKHDGETFERIRDYLERERQKQEQSGGRSDSNSPQDPQPQNRDSGANQSGDSQTGNDRQSGDPQSGDPQSGDPQSGDPQSGDPQSGDPQSGDPQSGDPQSGDPQSGDPQSGDPQSGDPQSGDPQSGDPQSGDPQSGDPQSGDPQSGDPQSGDPQSGDPQSGDPQSGDPQSGDPQSGDPQSGDPQSGDPQSGDPQSGDPQSGDPQSGDPQSGDPQSGDPQSGDPQSDQSTSDEASDSQPSENQSESGESAGEQRQPSDSESSSESRDSESQSSDSRSGDMSGQPRNSGSSSNSTPRGATGEGSDSAASGEEGDATPTDPPAEPNLDYTKKATDMVLDYLQETRDEPDRKLLEELQWDEDDLRRFSDRWQRIRELGQQPGTNSPNRDLEEALRSLGMRPENTTRQTTRDAADALRGIRDSGNRKPPPAAFRDAFDAFRRSLTP